MKRVGLSILFVTLMGIASSASACETCKKWGTWVTCWSGVQIGFQWCYGGFGEPCNAGDFCLNAEQLTTTPSDKDVCADPINGCTMTIEAAPGGFVLEIPEATKEPARANVSPQDA